jgi:hypothetical protein
MSLFDKVRLVRDLFWPLADPLPSDYVQQRAATLAAEIRALPSEKAILEEYKKTYASFLDAEEKRRQSVEARLTNIMGLSSIAGTIVFGTILAQIAGTLHVPSGILRWTIALGSLYLVMQICSAIFAAVRGLSRRGYFMLTLADFFPAKNESEASTLRDLVATYAKALSDHQSQNNIKVTWMAAAYRSMQQFLCGLLMFALIGTYFAIKAPAAENDLVETLKKNHELQDLLRGPTGPPGARGPKGERVAIHPCRK